MRSILTNKKFLFIIQLFGSVFFIYYVFKNVDFYKLWSTLKEVNTTYFYCYILFSFASLFLYVFRWQMVNKIIGVEVNYKELFKIYLIGSFFSNFLPGSLGGDIYRGYILSKRSNSVSKSLISIFFERGIGLYMMFFMGMCISLFYINEFPKYIFYFFFIIVFSVTTVIFIVVRHNLIIWLSRVKALSSLSSFFTAVTDFIEIIKKSPRNTFIIIITTIIYQLIATGITIFLYYSVGGSPEFFKMLSICILVFILVNVPISINGIGLREALFMYFSATIAISPEKNTIVSILIYITNLLIGLLGCAIYIHKKYIGYIKTMVR